MPRLRAVRIHEQRLTLISAVCSIMGGWSVRRLRSARQHEVRIFLSHRSCNACGCSAASSYSSGYRVLRLLVRGALWATRQLHFALYFCSSA